MTGNKSYPLLSNFQIFHEKIVYQKNFSYLKLDKTNRKYENRDPVIVLLFIASSANSTPLIILFAIQFCYC